MPATTSTSHQVLARKWRPKKFASVVGQQHVVKPVTNAISLGKLHHAYLLTGTRGVGKTSLARILAKAICCDQRDGPEPCGRCSSCTQIDEGRYLDLIEVDAASRSKVEETRDLLDNLNYSPASGSHRVYIIDEIHMFSRHSFNALLKALEEPPEHVTFILATTDYKKIPNTILSRCLQLHLKHLNPGQIRSRLAYILDQEKVEYSDEALGYIAQSARGSMRDALSLLDQAINNGEGRVDNESTRTMLGVASIDQAWELLEYLLTDDDALPKIIAAIDRYAEQIIDCEEILNHTLSFLQNLALVRSFPDLVEQEVFQTQAGRYDFAGLARSTSAENLHLYEQIAGDARIRLWVNPNPEQAVKVCFARMLLLGLESQTDAPSTEKPLPHTPATDASTTRNSGANARGAPPPSDQGATPRAKSIDPSPAARINPSTSARNTTPARRAMAGKNPTSGTLAKTISGAIDVREKLAKIGAAPGTEAMKRWEMALNQSEDIDKSDLLWLKKNVELVCEGTRWELRYSHTSILEDRLEKLLDQCSRALTQVGIDSVESKKVDDVGGSLIDIERYLNAKLAQNAIAKFSQTPVMRVLLEEMGGRLVKFQQDKIQVST